MRKNLLNNPIFIFILFLITAVVTTISSIYFFSIMLAGIQFLAFRESFKNKYYYSLMFVLLSFIFIEFNNGFKPLSLILLAFFTNIFIIPYLKRVVSLNNLNNFAYMFWFYVSMGVVWIITNDFSWTLVGTFFINIIIDFILFGVFI